MKDFAINIPGFVELIIERLNESGYEAFVVGGCVRDSILQKTPKDWDITTSAKPQQVKLLFPKTYDTGIQHGTITVMMNNEVCEVTTFRVDGIYQQHRKPSKVFFTDNVIKDLQRRDFTMNAMAYHPDTGLVDPFNGINDIENKIIRCVGVAAERFEEDALRMLRAIRFACQLDFEIEPSTLQAICDKSKLIAAVSRERIREELNRILVSDKPGKLLYLNETGIMPYILGDYLHHEHLMERHIIKAVENIEKDIILRWTMLLHDVGKPLCKTVYDTDVNYFHGHIGESIILADKILKGLKFDNKTISKVVRLIKWYDYPIEAHPKAIRKAVRRVGEDIFLDLLKVKEADIRAQNISFLDERMEILARIREIYHEIKRAGQCLSIKDLAVNGEDLICLGIPEGKKIGDILSRLLDLVIENPSMNDKEVLLDRVKDLYKLT